MCGNGNTVMKAKMEQLLRDFNAVLCSEEASEIDEEVLTGLKAAWADIAWWTRRIDLQTAIS